MNTLGACHAAPVPSHQPTASLPPARRGLRRLPNRAVDTWPVQFTGVDDDYAAIWLQGAVLSVLSLGLALPWARIRCRRYLLQHTRVAGQALDYHGRPAPMLVRQLLVMALVAGVALAIQASVPAGLLASTLAFASWPLLWLMGCAHRVNRMSWGRRPLALQARVRDVYRALGPPLGAAIALMWLAWALHLWRAPVIAWVGWALAVLVWVASVPLWGWKLLRLRQTHARLGPLRLRWQAPRQAIWELTARSLSQSVLVAAFGLGAWAVVVSVARAAWGGLPVEWVVGGLAMVLAHVVLCMGFGLRARLHWLTWQHTGNRSVRSRCRKSALDRGGVHARQAALVLVTGGIYWPWAQVATWRACAQATVIRSRVGVRTLTRHWPARPVTG